MAQWNRPKTPNFEEFMKSRDGDPTLLAQAARRAANM